MSRRVRFFVSYVRSDEASMAFARQLADVLEKRGHHVFVDVIDLDVGAPWEKELQKQIASCDAMVLLISERIGQSYVRRELELAAARNAKQGRPRVMPVRMNFTGTLGPDLDATLDALHYILWTGEADSAEIIDRIERSGRAAARRLWPAIVTALAIATLIGATFAWSMALLRTFERGTPAEVRVAHDRLRMLEWLGIPNLWLAGAWDPDAGAQAFFERRANTTELEAKAKWASKRREEMDEGLLMAALAALQRGSRCDPAAMAIYRAHHYDHIVATLRDPLEMTGHTLAAHLGPPLHIAEGSRVWSCSLPAWSCGAGAPLAAARVDGAAFLSTTQLVMLIDGRLTQWNVGTGKSAEIAGPAARCIAAREGELAIGRGNDVQIRDADGVAATSPALPAPVDEVVFGPCADCVTALAGGTVYQWNRREVAAVATQAKAIAASKGHLAIANDGNVTFDGVAVPVAGVDFTRLRSMSIAADGAEAALTHDGIVTIVRRNGTAMRLIDVDTRPGALEAVYAGELLVTRTFGELRIWNTRAASVREKTDPGALWSEWRQQLGLGMDASGEILPGSRGAPQFGWNRVRRRVEEYR